MGKSLIKMSNGVSKFVLVEVKGLLVFFNHFSLQPVYKERNMAPVGLSKDEILSEWEHGTFMNIITLLFIR